MLLIKKNCLKFFMGHAQSKPRSKSRRGIPQSNLQSSHDERQATSQSMASPSTLESTLQSTLQSNLQSNLQICLPRTKLLDRQQRKLSDANYKVLLSDRAVLVLVNTFTWISARDICTAVQSQGWTCFNYHAMVTDLNQGEDHVADVNRAAENQLREMISRSDSKVVVVVGTSTLGSLSPQHTFWLQMDEAELETEYRRMLEDQVQLVLNNVNRIKNAIRTAPVNTVSQALVQCGLDVDFTSSYKSFSRAYKAMTFLANHTDGYRDGCVLPKKGILDAIAKICTV